MWRASKNEASGGFMPKYLVFIFLFLIEARATELQSISLNYPQNQRVNKIEIKFKDKKYQISQMIKDQTTYQNSISVEKNKLLELLKSYNSIIEKLKKSKSEFGCSQKKTWIVEMENKKKIFCKTQTKDIALLFNQLSDLLK